MVKRDQNGKVDSPNESKWDENNKLTKSIFQYVCIHIHVCMHKRFVYLWYVSITNIFQQGGGNATVYFVLFVLKSK